MIIRIRSREGMERVSINNPFATLEQLKFEIENQLRIPIHAQILSKNRNLLLAKSPQDLARFTDLSNPKARLSSLDITHGSIVYLAHEIPRSISGPAVSLRNNNRKRKMTMDDLIAKQIKITQQEKPHCQSVSFDRDAANLFQEYVNDTLSFAVKRGGFMYGTVSEEGNIVVDFIYEPPQQGTEDTLILSRDSDEENLVEAIARGLGMRKVGFIFTQSISEHRRGYTMSNREILQAVELQMAGGLKEWVTAVVKMESDMNVHFEAFQMSDLCVRLFKEGWFEREFVDPKVLRTKNNVVVGGKDTRVVDNDFFLVAVKIFDHQGPLSAMFPVENRNSLVTMADLKIHLDRTRNVSFVKRISDFHLLLFISKILDINSDVPELASCVRTQAMVPDGYQLLIESLAATA